MSIFGIIVSDVLIIKLGLVFFLVVIAIRQTCYAGVISDGRYHGTFGK